MNLMSAKELRDLLLSDKGLPQVLTRVHIGHEYILMEISIPYLIAVLDTYRQQGKKDFIVKKEGNSLMLLNN